MKKEVTRFAVYGTLKKGRGNDARLRSTKFLGDHLTEPNYTMYSMGGFPAVVPEGNTSITIEVYETTDEDVINSVNALEGFSGIKNDPRNWYDTETIDTPYGKAEMFIFKTAPARPVVEGGKW